MNYELYKFVFDGEVQNSVFWYMSNLDLSHNSVAVNTNFKTKWFFWDSEINRKCKLLRVCAESEIKACFLRHFPTRHCADKILWASLRNELNEIFLWNVSQRNFLNVLVQLSKFAFWLAGLVLLVISKHFKDFLKIY